jgi:DNA modification methylase
MRHLPDGIAAVVATDPPYVLGTTSAYGGKLNPWADLTNAAFWFSALYREIKRITSRTGFFWTFLNWRSMVTIQKAAMDTPWQIESLLVWDKEWIGPGGSKGLRPSYELVALMCGEEASLENRSLYDIQRFAWSGHKPSGHPAEKPETLLGWIISNSSTDADLVIDPFLGSGTTAVAAKKLGRHYLGFEISPEYCAIARKRLETIDAQPQLFSPKPEQLALA